MESHKPILKDYYAILGVNADATAAEIKKAFRALAHQYHPDRVQAGSSSDATAEKMIELNEAFAVLSDEKRKKEYDDLRSGKKSAVVAEKVEPDWEIPTAKPASLYTVPKNVAVDQTVNSDFLEKIKNLLTQNPSLKLQENNEKSWTWALTGGTWAGHYWVGLRSCSTLSPSVAREILAQSHAVITKNRSGWKTNFFVFILAFQNLTEGESVLRILRTFCKSEGNSKNKNHVNIVAMDMSQRRSVLCGEKSSEGPMAELLATMAVS